MRAGKIKKIEIEEFLCRLSVGGVKVVTRVSEVKDIVQRGIEDPKEAKNRILRKSKRFLRA